MCLLQSIMNYHHGKVESLTGILLPGERLKYTQEYHLQQLSVCLPPLIQPLTKNSAVLDWNWQESHHHDTVH
jgi:hypothetical protein